VILVRFLCLVNTWHSKVVDVWWKGLRNFVALSCKTRPVVGTDFKVEQRGSLTPFFY